MQDVPGEGPVREEGEKSKAVRARSLTPRGPRRYDPCLGLTDSTSRCLAHAAQHGHQGAGPLPPRPASLSRFTHTNADSRPRAARPLSRSSTRSPASRASRSRTSSQRCVARASSAEPGLGGTVPFPQADTDAPRLARTTDASSRQNTGDPEAVALVKRRFGLEEDGGESKWGPTV